MNSKKIVTGLATGAILLIASAIPAFAAPAVHASPALGSQLNPGVTCDTSGTPVVNVDYKISNDADTAIGGTVWAMDAFNRNLQIWQQTDGSYCALIREAGQFVTLAGVSPINNVPLNAGITGTVDGGFTGTITGVFTPSVPTHGTLPASDYQCTSDPNPSCPGAFDWVSAYFPHPTSVNLYTFWGWAYHAGKNGSMVQEAPDIYLGDITN